MPVMVGCALGILPVRHLFSVDVIRWSLTAHNICFTNALHSQFFARGKCVPIVRGAGVYQKGMDFCIQVLTSVTSWFSARSSELCWLVNLAAEWGTLGPHLPRRPCQYGKRVHPFQMGCWSADSRSPRHPHRHPFLALRNGPSVAQRIPV